MHNVQCLNCWFDGDSDDGITSSWLYTWLLYYGFDVKLWVLWQPGYHHMLKVQKTHTLHTFYTSNAFGCSYKLSNASVLDCV